jgi:hypothetical protein
MQPQAPTMDHGHTSESITMSGRLLTREEAMERLRLKPAHFSKVANGKVKGLPRLACVRIGRRQLFREETIARWIVEVENISCNKVR